MLNTAVLPVEMGRIGISFLRLFYPAFCAICETTLTIHETNWCQICEEQLRLIKGAACPACARPLPPFHNSTRKCDECRNHQLFFDSGFSAFVYNEEMKSIIHQIKFEGKFWLVKSFRNLLKQHLISDQLARYDHIIPVPIDHERLKVRGFNQSELIAKELAGRSYLFKIKKILRKARQTAPQSELDKKGRLENLRNAFEVRYLPLIINRSLLLVDDVVTSGTTLNECARALKAHGAKRVDFFTLARTINT